MRTLAGRLVIGGLLATLAVGASGLALERSRFGSSDDAALSRVEGEFRRQFDDSVDALGAMAARVASERTAIQTALRDPAAATAPVRHRVERDSSRSGGPHRHHDLRHGKPAGGVGRPGDRSREAARQRPRRSFCRARSPRTTAGPRRAGRQFEPARHPSRRDHRRRTVTGRSSADARLAPDTAIVSTSLVPVTIRTEFDTPGTPGDRRLPTGNYAFVIPSRTGGLLVEAEVSRDGSRGSTSALAGPHLGGVRSRPRAHAHLVRGSAARPAAARSNHDGVSRRDDLGGHHRGGRASGAAVGRGVGGRPTTVRLTSQRAVERARGRGPGRARRRPPGTATRRETASGPLAEKRSETRSAITASRRSSSWPAPLAAVTARRVRAIPAADRREHRPRRPALLAAPVQRPESRHWGSASSFSMRPSSGAAAMLAYAGGVFWRRPRRWDLRATATIGWLAGAAAAVAVDHRADELDTAPAVVRRARRVRRLRGGVCRAVAPLASRVAGLPARRTVCGAAGAGDRALSIALLSRDGGKGTPHRDDIRAAGDEPAQGSQRPSVPDTRTDRRDARDSPISWPSLQPSRRRRSIARLPCGRTPRWRPTA